MPDPDVLIVGAGQAGAQTAVMLRQNGFTGSIAMIGEEPHLPYDRPPLSKEYLQGTKTFEQMTSRTAQRWAELDIALVTGQRVMSVDAEAHRVRTADSTTIGYRTLVWAAGGTARRLRCDGNDASGIHSIRNRADVDALLAELPQANQIAVIGGGYIGLEAAAAMVARGKRVILLEALDRVLARVAAEPLSRFYEAEHRARGVDIRLGVTVAAIERRGDRVSGIRLNDGTMLPVDIMIVGIGIAPATEPLSAAGAESGNGVRVDGHCRTSLPDIFAIGDCAEHRNAFADDAWVRLESVQNANDQASTVANTICGDGAPYHAVPWFWSNQYDLRLQTVGLSQGHDDVVVRGNMATRSFSVVYLRRGNIIALDCVNMVRDYSHGRVLVAVAAKVDRLRLADPSLPLKSFLPAA